MIKYDKRITWWDCPATCGRGRTSSLSTMSWTGPAHLHFVTGAIISRLYVLEDTYNKPLSQMNGKLQVIRNHQITEQVEQICMEWYLSHWSAIPYYVCQRCYFPCGTTSCDSAQMISVSLLPLDRIVLMFKCVVLKIGIDTAEKESSSVLRLFCSFFQSYP